jgi:hypothetical protein
MKTQQSEKKKWPKQQLCIQTQYKHWHLRALLRNSNEVTGKKEQNTTRTVKFWKESAHIQHKSPGMAPAKWGWGLFRESRMLTGETEKHGGRPHRSPLPTPDWWGRWWLQNASPRQERRENGRSHRTEVTPVRWGAFSPPVGQTELLLANWGYEAGGSEARLGGCYCL